jgi:nucleotide-binding universal stress UspA family protein
MRRVTRLHTVGVFDRIVCAVDGSDASVAAVQQAEQLLPPDRALALVSVAEPAVVASPVGALAAAAVVPLEAAEEAVASARAALRPETPVEVAVVTGGRVRALRRVLDERRASLVAFGVHEHPRLEGIVLGSVGTALVHHARCAVLAARPARDDGFPGAIVVGVDGSLASLRAVDAALEISQRCHAPLTCLIADANTVEARVARRSLELEWPALHAAEDARHPVEALLAADAGLLVLGSRGLHGARALGAVSERVVHRAHCSVLVVR